MEYFIKFLGIGGVSTLIQFILLALLVEFDLAPEVIASAISYFLSSIVNYLANYHLTFFSQLSHGKTLPKFAVTVGLGLTISTLLFTVFLKLLGNYLEAQFLATGITLCLNFLAHKLWIYKDH